MKERVRDYEPIDPRSVKLDQKGRKKGFDPNAPHEFEALFVMHRDAQPEKKDKNDRQNGADKIPADNQQIKGIER